MTQTGSFTLSLAAFAQEAPEKARDVVRKASQSVLAQFPDAPASLLVSAEADVFPLNHPELSDLIDGIEHHGCAVLTAETLTHVGRNALAERLAKQPPWSDFPLVLFAPSRADVADRDLDEVKVLGNVAILEMQELSPEVAAAFVKL